MDLQAFRAARRDAPFEALLTAPEWRPFTTFLARFFDLHLTETPGVIEALDAVEASFFASPSDEVRGDDDTVLLLCGEQWWGITRDEAALRRLAAILPERVNGQARA